jgi:hypothetical protein
MTDEPTPTEPEPETPEPEPEPEPTGDSDDELRRARTALTAERRARKVATDELERIKREGLGEQERAIEEAKSQARAEVRAEYNMRVLRAEVRAAAADRAVDPDAVVALLDLSAFELDDDGRSDPRAVSGAVAELLKEKPYLAKPAIPDSKRMPQGTRGSTGAPAGNGDAGGEAWLRSIRR